VIINIVKETDVRFQDSLRGNCGGHSKNGTGLSSAKKLSALLRKKLMQPLLNWFPNLKAEI
jgi:hypothetical protein